MFSVKKGIIMMEFTSNQREIECIRQEYPVGCTVRLEEMYDPYPVKSGTCGTVFCVDDLGQIHVKWETGSSLALIPGIDRFSKV